MQIRSVFTLFCFQFFSLDTFTVFCRVFINKLGHPNLCQSTWHNPTLKRCKTHNIYWMAETIKIPFQCQPHNHICFLRPHNHYLHPYTMSVECINEDTRWIHISKSQSTAVLCCHCVTYINVFEQTQQNTLPHFRTAITL